MNKFMFFKSATCGPCKLFYPQVEKAAAELRIELTVIDVNEDTVTPEKFNVTSSGTLLLINKENEQVLKTWERPCPAHVIIQDCNN